jgi:hypothetical protein
MQLSNAACRRESLTWKTAPAGRGSQAGASSAASAMTTAAPVRPARLRTSSTSPSRSRKAATGIAIHSSQDRLTGPATGAVETPPLGLGCAATSTTPVPHSGGPERGWTGTA